MVHVLSMHGWNCINNVSKQNQYTFAQVKYGQMVQRYFMFVPNEYITTFLKNEEDVKPIHCCH